MTQAGKRATRVAIVCVAPLRDVPVVGGTYSAVLGETLLAQGIEAELWTRASDAKPVALDVPVIQVWRSGPLAWFDLLRAAIARKPDLVHVQHYFFLLGNGGGGELSNALLLLGLWCMRTNIVVTLHDVPGKEQITPEYVRLHNYNYPAAFVRAGLGVLFRFMAWCAGALIVHDDLFRERVAAFGVPRSKMQVISHMPLSVTRIGREQARIKLGIGADVPVVLFFGYATGYKGIEDLLAAFELLADRGSDVRLILGAGPHPKLFTAEYRAFYDAMERKARSLPNVDFAGFITATDLDTYISAADAGILPYVEFHGASGPLYFYLAHGRPVLVSKAIADHAPGYDGGAFQGPGEMAEVISAFFNDAAVADAVRSQSERLRVDASSGAWIDATRAVYDSLLGTHARADCRKDSTTLA